MSASQDRQRWYYFRDELNSYDPLAKPLRLETDIAQGVSRTTFFRLEEGLQEHHICLSPSVVVKKCKIE